MARIAALAERFSLPAGAGAVDRSIVRGIGDDAAVLDLGARGQGAGEPIVWTVDAQVEGVHFRTDLASWADVGWRSFMAAASDLAAMGASPWCALSSLVLPRSFDDDALGALTEGQAEAARVVGAPVVGGNLARGSEVSITTTLLGTCARPLPRTAARGDGIWVSGPLGLAAAGLAALERKLPTSDPDVARAVLAWRRPRALIQEGLALATRAAHVRGAIDVSDGFAQDTSHIARASGLKAIVEESALRSYLELEPTLGALAKRLGVSAVDLALHGGEDYALVVAGDDAIGADGFVRLGRFEAGAGVVLETDGGAARAIDARGFDHFR
jgi:thiamine-monophosphate kinase